MCEATIVMDPSNIVAIHMWASARGAIDGELG